MLRDVLSVGIAVSPRVKSAGLHTMLLAAVLQLDVQFKSQLPLLSISESNRIQVFPGKSNLKGGFVIRSFRAERCYYRLMRVAHEPVYPDTRFKSFISIFSANFPIERLKRFTLISSCPTRLTIFLYNFVSAGRTQ